MASSAETKEGGSCGSGSCGGGQRRHGPKSEEERQQCQAEMKQEFFDEYRKRYGDQQITAEQTWELCQALIERKFAKMKEHCHPSATGDSSDPSQHGGPHRFEEKRKEILAWVQQEFEKDFTASHGTNKVNADQAWEIVQKMQERKREKWQAMREQCGGCHGSGDQGRRSPPTNQ